MALRRGDELPPWQPAPRRCAVFGCQAPKRVQGEGEDAVLRRWCKEHAEVHDRDAHGALAVILSFPGGRRIKNEVAEASTRLRRLLAKDDGRVESEQDAQIVDGDEAALPEPEGA